MKRYWKRPERLLDALVIGLAMPTIAVAATMTNGELSQAKTRAAADYKAAIARCATLSANPKDVCKAEAKAAQVRAKSEAEATFRNTDKARRDAQAERAAADYGVARVKCDALAGDAKIACVKEAKISEIKARSETKVAEKVVLARHDAVADRRDGDLNAALEKCNPLADSAKEACVANAKAKAGR